MQLTRQQQQFADEYLVDLNATQAAIRAGYSEKTARSQGQRLLTNVDIAKSIEEAMEARSERTQITSDSVVAELGGIAFTKLNETGIIKPGDKIRALELLGRHLKMFTDNVVHGVDSSLDKIMDHINDLDRGLPTKRH